MFENVKVIFSKDLKWSQHRETEAYFQKQPAGGITVIFMSKSLKLAAEQQSRLQASAPQFKPNLKEAKVVKNLHNKCKSADSDVQRGSFVWISNTLPLKYSTLYYSNI